MYLVKLATLLETMNQFQTVQTVDDPAKIRWIDVALNDDDTDYKLPFRRKQTSLRVFDGIVIYPAPSDYDELSYVDNDELSYSNRARFRYSSYNEFFEDKDNRNDLAEIMDGEEVFIGCRYQTKNANNRMIDNAENATNYICSGDASNPVIDNVLFKEGNGSIRFTITQNTGSAIIENTFNSLSDLLYKQKYNFRYVYLDGIPTSISMRFGNGNGNYLYSTVTKQFSGQNFKEDAWNLVAFDLNIASTLGVIDPTQWKYQGLELTGAPSGTYYVDTSYVRQWELLDNFWYYSSNKVKSVTGVYKENFIDPTTEQYDPTDSLIGSTNFGNYICYVACLLVAIDKGDVALITNVSALMTKAGNKIPQRYQVVKPLITNQNWRFKSNLMSGRSKSWGPNSFFNN